MSSRHAQPGKPFQTSRSATGTDRGKRLPHVDRLLKTTALTAVVLALSGTVAYCGPGKLWRPQVRTMIGAQDHGGGTVLLDGFLPLRQGPDSAIILDTRLKHDFDGGSGQDIGLVLRRIANPDLMLGGYVYFDTETVGGHRFYGSTFGIEAVTPNLDAHLNAFLPFGKGTETHDTSYDLSLVGNQLLERASTFSQRRYGEWGVEGEIGVNAPIDLPDGQSLRLDVGGYHFADRTGEGRSATGAKAGFEYTIGDVFGRGSKLAFTGEVRYDDRDKSQFAAGVHLTIPLGSPPEPTADDGAGPRQVGAASPALRKRLNERVRGDVGVHVRTEDSLDVVTRVALDADTGQAFGSFFFADGANTLGLGTLGDPTTLDDAVAKAGAGGFAVALGGSGDLTTPGVALANGETLVGGGGRVTARLADGTVEDFAFGGTDGTVHGTDPGRDVVTLADFSTVRELTITGGHVGIAAAGVDGATLADLTVTGAASDGLSLSGASTGFSGIDLTSSGNGGDGLHIEGDGIYAFSGTTTLSGNGGDGLDASGNGTYGFQRLDALDNSGDGIRVSGVSTGATFTTTGGTISGNGGTAIHIDPVTADVTLDSVSQDGGTAGIVLDRVSGSFTVTGDTTISNTSGSAITVSDTAATVRFADVAVSNAGEDGLSFAGDNAGVSAEDIAVSGVGPGGAGLDFSGSNTTFSARSVDISGAGAGSIGIDLSRTTGNARIAIADGGTISGVDTGVRLGIAGSGAATANATFSFGGGTVGGVSAALDTRGLRAGSGTYAFGSTAFDGRQLFDGRGVVFVGSAATGFGDGSTVNDLATIDVADAITDPGVVFALVNDGSPIVTAGGFTLSDDQTLASFGNGRTFDSAGAPDNVTGDNIVAAGTQSDPTGMGAATLAAGPGVVRTVELANGDLVADLTISNASAGGGAIHGTGIDGLSASGLTLDGGAFGLQLTGATGSINLNSLDVTGVKAGGAAIEIRSSSADVAIRDLTVDVAGTGGAGVVLAGDAGGSIAMDGTTTIDAAGVGIGFEGGGKLEIRGSSTIASTGDSALRVRDAGADVTLGLSDVTASAGGGRPVVDIDGTGGGRITIDRFADLAIVASGSESGGLRVVGGDATLTPAGKSVRFGNGTPLAGGNLTIGTAAARIGGDGLVLTNVEGSLGFDDLTIANDGGTGMDVTGSLPNAGAFTLAAAGGSVDTQNGAAARMNRVTLDVTLSALSSTASQASGASFRNVRGRFAVTGRTGISGAATGGLEIADSPAALAFGDTTITGLKGGNGIDVAGTNGTIAFGNISMSGIGDGRTGLDLSGSLADFTARSLNITGSGSSTGIDLSGTRSGSRAVIANGGTIQGTGTGVQLGTHGAAAATADDAFVFGGGSISGTVASLDMRGLSETSGTYAFRNTELIGPQLSDPAKVIFVGSTATGTRDGSSVANLANIDMADDMTDPTIIFALVNDGTTITDTTGFSLSKGQTLASFGNGRTFRLGTAPVNVTGDHVEAGGAQGDPTGNGAATLTTTGNTNTLSLGGDNKIEDVTVLGVGNGSAIGATGVSNIEMSGVDISGGARGLDLRDVGGTIALADITVSNTSGDGIHIQNSSAALTATGTVSVWSTGGNGIDFSGAATGSASFQSVSIAGSLGGGLVLDGYAGSLDFDALTVRGGTSGIAILDGTSGTATFGALSSIGSVDGIAFRIDNSAPTVAYDGTIVQNNAANAVYITRMTGGSASFGGLITAKTSTTAAIVLDGNAGGTIGFDGGLVLTTSSGAGFQAVNGGNVTVTGTGNRIATGTGTALTVSDTAIGAAGLTFQSISVNGATRGIVLRNTGSAGGLTVTGTGTTKGSGGTIRNISVRGVEIVNASKITLNNMNFVDSSTTDGAVATSDNTASLNAAVYLNGVDDVSMTNDHISGGNQDGVIAVKVHNFAFNGGTIDHAGDDNEEGAIIMSEVTGLVTLNDDDLSFAASRTVEIRNSTGAVTVNIDNTTMRDNQMLPFGQGGLQLLAFGTATDRPSATVNVTNSTFLRLGTDGVNVQTGGSVPGGGASADVDITGSTFDPGDGWMGGIDLDAGGTSTMVFNVMDNPRIWTRRSVGVNIFAYNSAVVQGRINDNPDIRTMANETGWSIGVGIDDDAVGRVQIDNNVVHAGSSDDAIDITSDNRDDPNGGYVDITLTNNDISVGAAGAYGIWVLAAVGADETNLMRLNIAGNAVHMDPANKSEAFRVLERGTNGGVFFQNFTGDVASTWTANGNTPAGSVTVEPGARVGAGTPELPTNDLPDADP